MQQVLQLLSIFPTWAPVPMCLSNHIGRLLALTSNETCDNSCHTGGSHAIVAGVWYSLFESLRRRTIWLKFPDDLQWIQTSLSTQLSRRNAHKTDFCVRLKIHLLIHVKKGFDVGCNMQIVYAGVLTSNRTCNRVLYISASWNSINVIPKGYIFL